MSTRHDLALLAGRTVLGSYLAAHGAQKLFGAFGGGGIQTTAAGFHRIGLRPGRAMAMTAGLSELGGGLLTITGFAYPLGPVALVGTMAVASTTHRANGPFSAKRGFELPLTNLASALVLAMVGPGRYSVDHAVGSRLPKWLTALSVIGAAGASAASIAMLFRAEPEPTPAPPNDTKVEPGDGQTKAGGQQDNPGTAQANSGNGAATNQAGIASSRS
jgi:putative oxidoreductase